MNDWRVVYLLNMTDEQKKWMNPIAFSDRKDVVLAAKSTDSDSMEGILIGDNTPKNRWQAQLICDALNADDSREEAKARTYA